jgi:hypothetical protein
VKLEARGGNVKKDGNVPQRRLHGYARKRASRRLRDRPVARLGGGVRLPSDPTGVEEPG